MMMVRMRVVVCVLVVLTGGAVRAQLPGTATGSVSSTVAREDQSGQVQVCVETRIMAIAKKRLPPEILDPANKQWQGGFLDDKQVAALVRSSQQDKGSTVITAPRITVDDGGEASVSVTTPHQYRAAKATTRPDGSQEYALSVKDDAWDGIREKITAKTDTGHQVTNIRFQLTIQRLLDMEKFQIKPTGSNDKAIEYESPLLQIIDMDNDIAVPSGKTALLGGHILAGKAVQTGSLIPLAGEDKGGDVERMLVVLVKPTIIGNPSTRPAVLLPQAERAAAAAATRTSGEDAGTVAPGIIAADNRGEGEYYIGGQVARGGVYSPGGRQITLKQAAVSAGIDNKTILPGAKVDLIRRLPGNKESFSTVDVAAIFKGTQPDYYLQPYDLLIVHSSPQAPASAQPAALPGVQTVGGRKIALDIIPADSPGNGEYYMGGHVKRVGVYSLTGRQITLKQAIVSAGGLDAEIRAGMQSLLIRRLPGNKEQMIPIDLEALFQGTQPDRYLQPNDVLQVGTHPPATPPAKVSTEHGAVTKPVGAATRPNDPSAVIVQVYDVGNLLTWERAHAKSATIEDVRDLIMAEVEPQSWVEAGPGRMQPGQGDTLVVWHTAAGHEKIAQFIKKKTEEMVQVLIETKVLAIDKQKAQDALSDPATKKSRGGIISEAQANALQIGEECLGVRVTVFDGVKGHADVSTERNYVGPASATTRPNGTVEFKTKPETVWEGFRMDVIAQATKDRKSVRLQVDPKVQKILKMETFEFKPVGKNEQPIKYQSPVTWTADSANDVTVPDGQWICLGGQTIPDGHAGADGATRVQIILVKATIIDATEVAKAK